MPIVKSGGKIPTKWYNNNYDDCKLAVLKFARANEAILFSMDDFIHMQVGFKDIKVYFVKKEKTGIDIEVKSFFMAYHFMKKFYLEIGQFLEE